MFANEVADAVRGAGWVTQKKKTFVSLMDFAAFVCSDIKRREVEDLGPTTTVERFEESKQSINCKESR